MTSPVLFLVILVAAIALLMLLILKLKVHPVLGLFTAALITGVALGYGLVTPKIEGIGGTVDLISAGFGNTLGGVGITIILGAIISMAIEIGRAHV